MFEPGSTVFWDAIRAIEPSLYKRFNPWDSITTVPAVEELFAVGGAIPVEAEVVPGQQELTRPEDFWDIVLGTGYRATVDALTADQRRAVHDRVVDSVRAEGLESVRTDFIHASAIR